MSGYRLTVFRLKTPAIDATGPGTLNTTGSKTTFYAFHAAPEFLAASLLLVFDMRSLCGTGLYGDWRWSDKKDNVEKASGGSNNGGHTSKKSKTRGKDSDAVGVQQIPV